MTPWAEVEAAIPKAPNVGGHVSVLGGWDAEDKVTRFTAECVLFDVYRHRFGTTSYLRRDTPRGVGTDPDKALLSLAAELRRRFPKP